MINFTRLCLTEFVPKLPLGGLTKSVINYKQLRLKLNEYMILIKRS